MWCRVGDLLSSRRYETPAGSGKADGLPTLNKNPSARDRVHDCVSGRRVHLLHADFDSRARAHPSNRSAGNVKSDKTFIIQQGGLGHRRSKFTLQGQTSSRVKLGQHRTALGDAVAGAWDNPPAEVQQGLWGERRNTNERPTWHTGQMAFRIEYFREGLLAGSTPHPGPQDETENFAKAGMIRHRADFYRIIDVASNTQVASGRRDG
jgi:hypothetical protein